MKFKKSDYVILAIASFFLGVFIISQSYAGRKARELAQPQNNEVIALEVARLTKGNADLRREVLDLTEGLGLYRNTNNSSRSQFDQYQRDLTRLSVINGEAATSGQGVIITIEGKLGLAQIVDFVNAIKNIGSEVIEVNGQRLRLGVPLSQFAQSDKLTIKVLGNSSLVKSAMERRGGIVEQIKDKNVKIDIQESEDLTFPSSSVLKFHYARIIIDD